MNKFKTLSAIALVLLLLGALPVAAQFDGKAKDHVPVTFNANVTGAIVYIDGNRVGLTPLKIGLKPGTYDLRVIKSGAGEYRARITVEKKANQVFRANLRQKPVPVQFIVNVRRAELYLNGVKKGMIPGTFVLKPGRYNVRIVAKGFRPLEKKLVVTGEARQRVNLNLQKPGTQVQKPKPQQNPPKQQTPPKQKKPKDEQKKQKPENQTAKEKDQKKDKEQKDEKGPKQSAKDLVQSELKIIIPAEFQGSKPGTQTLKVYIDGKRISPQQLEKGIPIGAGAHRIRVSTPSDVLSVEREFFFDPSESYTLELQLDMILKQ